MKRGAAMGAPLLPLEDLLELLFLLCSFLFRGLLLRWHLSLPPPSVVATRRDRSRGDASPCQYYGTEIWCQGLNANLFLAAG